MPIIIFLLYFIFFTSSFLNAKYISDNNYLTGSYYRFFPILGISTETPFKLKNLLRKLTINPKLHLVVAPGMSNSNKLSNEDSTNNDFSTENIYRLKDQLESIASKWNILLTCLPNIDASIEVFLGEGGILEHSSPETILVDHSTVDIDTSKLIWEKSLDKSIYFLDAPISGGPEGAKGGSLTIMCGGDSVAFVKIKPVLEMMGSSVVHMGGAGTGTGMKLVNQLLTSVNTVAAIEALLLADESGIDVKSALSVLKTSFGYSRMVERNVPYFAKKRFENSKIIWEALKDIKSVLIPQIPNGYKHVAYRCNILLNPKHLIKGFNRDRIMNLLEKNKIQCFVGSCPEIYNEKIF